MDPETFLCSRQFSIVTVSLPKRMTEYLIIAKNIALYITKFHLNRSSIYRYISIVNFSSIGSAVSEKEHRSVNFLV